MSKLKWISIVCFCLLVGIAFSFAKDKPKKEISDETRQRIDALTAEVMNSPGAENLKQETYDINGKTFLRDQLIWDFINVAISKDFWLDDDDYPAGLVSRFRTLKDKEKNYEWDKKDYPIIADHLYHTNGFPKTGVINRWNNKITIGIGWPQIAVPREDPSKMSIHPATGFVSWADGDPNGDPDKHPGVYPLFESQIVSLIPEIERLTGLTVSLVSPDSPGEINEVNNPNQESKEHARLRIVPTPFVEQRTTTLHRAGKLQPSLVTGVAFTPHEIGQVEGYFLPNPDNVIDFSACMIDPNLNEDAVRAFITECLVRAVGLPSLSKVNKDAALGHWNEAVGEYTEKFINKWLEEKLKENESKEIVSPSRDNLLGMYWKTVTHFEYPYQLMNTQDLENGFSLYDKFMMSLLYCSDIKAGMGVFDLIELLKSDSKCLRESEQKIRGG